MNRRKFIRRSLAVSTAVAWGTSYEEQALLAQTDNAPSSKAPEPADSFPMGRLGQLRISRLICGGNLISGFAHSRDLLYVSPLLKHYFGDAKVMETLALCEQHGINTTILRLDDETVRLLKRYRRERQGKIQWIAQVKLPANDPFQEIKRAVDEGAVAVFVHGGVGDERVQQGQVGDLAKALAAIRREGVLAGIAGHSIEVPKAVERAGLKPDFYMKTFNSKNYWSAGPMPRNDSVWEETPEETRSFMADVECPWIGYKVLGAGAIHPEQGFRYAFDHGADFICVGMFDFQVAEDARIARAAVAKAYNRERPWLA
ncbi:MAG TPA: hypothetical protein P5186_05705 [Candidatus Paceibacterota bacterium]|nr:hypothetical protein [Verrucomicrobiota bacterium]HRY47523.1 hypothetical protein [Candidatus Paceibacterota bacterium]HSA01908.1 hypothetical protein [Candidatus Paceibacterota bacterium]